MNAKDSERLSRYLDGELTPSEMREVEALLATSPEAREEYTVMKQIHETTLDLLPETRFDRPRIAVPRRRPLFRLAVAAAVAVLFGGVVFGAVQVYEAYFAESTSSSAPESPPPVSREPVAPGALAEDRTPPAQEPPLLTAAAEAPETPAAGAPSIDELSPPPLKGVVTDISGNPVPGASVHALAWLGAHPYGLDDDPVRGVTRTGADGRFAMDWPAEARVLRVDAPGYQDMDVEYRGGVLARDIELHARLRPEMYCTGRVVDSAGTPLAGVRVAAEYADDSAQDVAVTGEDGMFRVVSRGSRGPLYFSHPGFALTWSTRRTSEPVETVMLPGASFRLRVVQGGQPVPGAVVQVISEIPEALGYAFWRETDETGCVLFDQVPADPLALEDIAVFATAPNGVKARLLDVPELRPGAVTETVLTLPESYPGAISGTVADAEGNPLAGILVIAGAPNEVPLCARTDASGVYRMGLPFGDCQVFIDPNLLAPGQIGAQPRNSHFQVNTPGTTFTQDFTVLTAVKDITFVRSDGVPVEDLWLRMWPVLPTDYDDSTRWKVTAAGGQIRAFCLTLYRGFACDPAGELAAIWNMPEEQTEATIVLDLPAGAIAGRVVDPKGQPLAGAELNTCRTSEGYAPAYAWTGADGRFRIEPLPINAAYDLFVSLQGYQLLPGSPVTRLQAAKDPAPLEIVMAPRDAGLFGQVVAADGSPLHRAYLILADSERTLNRVYAGVDGTFFFEVAKGAYTLWAIAPALDAATSVTVEAPSQDTVITLPVQALPPVTVVPAPQTPESERAENNFKQMGLVFKMFANEAPGAIFPPLEPQQGVFTPEWKKIYPEYLTDPQVLFPNDGIARCYFAHALTSEAQGLAFLDAVQQLGIEAVRDQDIQVGAGKGTAGGDVILRLQEGIENRLLPELPQHVGPLAVQPIIPVMWEVPGEREESGGWVLYMDGHVQWQPYPGPFPMTEAFVTRVRGIMGLDR